MTQKDNDDLADALSAMSAGVPSGPQEADPHIDLNMEDAESPPQPRPQPIANPPPRAKPIVPTPTKAAGRIATTAASKPRPTAIPAQRRTVSPMARPAIPSPSIEGDDFLSPSDSESGETLDAPVEEPANVIFDDDAMLAPAPTPDVFRHRPATRKPRTKFSKSVEFKRAVIPVSLTCGLLLLWTAALELLLPSDNPLSAPVPWAPYALIAMGLGCTLSGLTMLQVKDQMAVAELNRAAR